MIHYVVTGEHRYTIDRFLTIWMQRAAWQVRVIPYERLRHQRWFAGGTYIFTDMERVDAATRRWAAHVAARLRSAGNRVLNDPARALSRFELLQKLHEEGLNSFSAYREPEWHLLNYPAFLRLASEHTGSLTPLLRGPDELSAAIAELPADVRREDIIAVEFVDTRDAMGVYQKFSVHRVGPHYVPRHVFFTRDWVGKYAELAESAELAAEAAFVENNPHGAAVRAAFELAGIEYGRIDFGMREGRVQVWEINTNATLTPGMERIEPDRFKTLRRSSLAICAAFSELARDPGTDCRIDVRRADARLFGLTAEHAFLATAGRFGRKCRATAAGRAMSRWWDTYV